jgi:hypothetical protein
MCSDEQAVFGIGSFIHCCLASRVLRQYDQISEKMIRQRIKNRKDTRVFFINKSGLRSVLLEINEIMIFHQIRWNLQSAKLGFNNYKKWR